MARRAIIHCFSGTGNAARLARIAAEESVRLGVRAAVNPMERPHVRGEADLVGIVAPVIGFGLPRMAARFLRRLPPGKGKKAFVLAARGSAVTVRLGRLRISLPAPEGVALLQAAAWLRLRGYAFAGAAALEMPTNWILAVDPPNEARLAAMTDRAAARIRRFVESIAAGARPPGGGRLAAAACLSPILGPVCLLFGALGRRLAGKWFTATERCTGCGRCAAECPQGTIRMRRGVPRWGWDCQQCFRCISCCPLQAVEVSGTALLATFAPLLFVRRLSRLAASLPSGGGAAGVACCLGLMAAAAGIAQAIGSRRRGGIPGWKPTRGRRRYRETGFDPSAFRAGEPGKAR
ncbi:MAG TPA: EFR1 family ferrodoxin [bacterium]|nr:EFR1 family ferrodoxin [bacterium]